MKGTQQGDFSRLLFDQRKHYRAVGLQQGRVQLDSDWNAQVALTRYRQQTETLDVVGQSAAPANDAGFRLAAFRSLELGPKHRHFVFIGSGKGCDWPASPPEATALTFEACLAPRGSGVVFSRWAPKGDELHLADRLEIVDGQLRYLRSGKVKQVMLEGGPLGLDGRQYRLTVVSEADRAYLWVDGEQVAGAHAELPPLSPAKHNYLILGADFDFRAKEPVDQLESLFSDFRWWAGARSEQEIRSDPDSSPELCSPLLGWWPFEEADGSLVSDRSGNENHGAVHGHGPTSRSPVWVDRMLVGAGRYYAGGLLCENEQTVDFEQQVDYPGAELPRKHGTFLFFLDAWEREVTAIQDPTLREIALEGPDTTTRTRAIAQVKAMELGSLGDGVDLRSASYHELTGLPEWQQMVGREQRRGTLRFRYRPIAGSELGNDLYRVEIHHSGGGLGGSHPADWDAATKARTGDDGRTLRLERSHDFEPGQPVEIRLVGGHDEPLAERREKPTPAVVERVDNRTLILDRSVASDAVAPGAEVMVRRLASFKWSRRNGSQCYPIYELAPGGRLVKLKVSAQELEICAGDWVEILDDSAVLQQRIENLCEVESVDGHQISLVQPAPIDIGSDPSRHPMLRRWDWNDNESQVTQGGVGFVATGWHPLDRGIELEFDGDGRYRSGDYWIVPSRRSEQDVEWPQERGEPLASPPHGVEHHYAPLALLVSDEQGLHLEDLRRTFQPLERGAVSKAGDKMEGDLIIDGGLEVWKDLKVLGRADLAEIHGRLCGEDLVDTPQLVDGSVTLDKLAGEVGVVPAGYSILGPLPSPEGYETTGSRLKLFDEQPEWVDRFEIPTTSTGPYYGAQIDGKTYTLLETGELWIFDPTANAWRQGRELPVRHRRFAVAAVANELHVVGGLDAAGNCCDDHLVYDPTRDAWREARAMPTARSDLAVAVFDGRLHALGGLRQIPLLGWLLGRYASTKHEVYDPATDTWQRRRSMPEACYTHAAAATSHSIHTVGGQRRWLLRLWGRIRTSNHQLYRVHHDRWERCAELPSPRSHLSLVEIAGRLFAIGGQGPGWLADCEVYNPAIDRWQPMAPLHEPIESPAVTVVEGTLYVTGARRFPEAAGVLIEECRVMTVYYAHRRQGS